MGRLRTHNRRRRAKATALGGGSLFPTVEIGYGRRVIGYGRFVEFGRLDELRPPPVPENTMRFRVGDIVTRDGTDRQRIVSISDDVHGTADVECLREPLGFFNDDGTRGEPWCRLGEVSTFMIDRLNWPDDAIDGRPLLAIGR